MFLLLCLMNVADFLEAESDASVVVRLLVGFVLRCSGIFEAIMGRRGVVAF